MATPKPLYLTTTLPYVNADPHIGFALELVQADAIARYAKLIGRDVFFNTGTDEHGQKILQKAQEEGTPVEEYVAHYASRFGQLQNALNIGVNAFIRTTDKHHEKAAQAIWLKCINNIGPDGPDIYKKKYKGLYCVGDEMFLRENDLVNGRCPNHPNLIPQEIEEENYFFRLSRYTEDILHYLEDETVIVPKWRREEAINFVKNGLEDFSISRDKSRLTWGIPVPNDENQVMYVWFDALTNYISTLGWPDDVDGKFEKYWNGGERVQIVGKDQIRFQSIMWQGMLMSADIKGTNRVIYHGFITSGGQKMSKSLGNVIDPLSLVNEYGAEAVRYFLLRHIHPFEDSDFTMERFKEAYNADLANGLGNLAARVMTLAERNLDTPVTLPEPVGFEMFYTDPMSRYESNSALAFAMGYVDRLDKEITYLRPFEVIKNDPAAGKIMITKMAIDLYEIARMIQPFMPKTSDTIKAAILANKKPENLFPRKE